MYDYTIPHTALTVQWSLLYKTTLMRDHLTYKTTPIYPNCLFYIIMNLSYKTTCLIRPLLSYKRHSLCPGISVHLYYDICT